MTSGSKNNVCAFRWYEFMSAAVKSLPKQFDSTRGRSLGAMGHWTLRSLLSRQPQEPVIQTPDYKGIFANKYLRKQKRSELRAFLASDAVYAIVEGPPGSGKTACIQDVAAELHYALKELDVEGEYKDERSLSLARSLFNHDMADILKGNDGSKVVTLVYNVNIVENPGVWVLPERKEKTTKVIFELHDTPKEMAPLIRRGLVRKITFEKFQPASLKMIAAAIGFRNPPGAVLACGDAHMLYTASVTRDSDAWKDAQLKPFSEAEELLRGHRTDMSNDLTPFFLHQHCGQFMSLEAGASFLEDLALADTIATASWKGGSASETDHHYSLETCPFLAVSAAHYADSLPSRIDWSGKLRALAPRPDKKRLALALQTFRLATDMPATSVTDRSPTEPAAKRRRAEESAARANAGASSMASAEEGSLASAFGMAAPVAAHDSVMRRPEPVDPAAVESEEPEAKRRRLEEATLHHVGGASSSGGDVVATIGATTLVPPVGLGSFKYEDRVLVASDARTASFYLTSPHKRRGVAGGGLPLEKFTEEFRMEAKRDLPDRFKKFTLLVFEPDRDFTVEEFWVHFAHTIGLRPGRHQDVIAVCSWPNRPKTLVVAYQKQDQRKVSIPFGFCERYVIGVAKRGEPRYTVVDVLSKLLDLGTKQVRNFVDEVLDDNPSAIEVVSVVQSQEPGALALTQLEAALVPVKKRTALERALTTEWHITKRAVKQMEEPRTQAIYASKVQETGTVQLESVFKPSWWTLRITIHDRSLLTPLMPRVGDQTSNVVTMETYLKFPGLNQSVTLFITGEPRKGKSELAKLICLMLAAKLQAGDPHFLMTSTLDALRASQALMLPGVPVLLDDIGGDEDDAQLIYSSVSMWKAILQVKDRAQIRGRNDDIMWAARQPKVISSNCKDLADWTNTMFPRAKPNHKEAIPPRVAECEPIRESLYSGCVAQSASQSFLPEQRSTQEAADYIKALYD